MNHLTPSSWKGLIFLLLTGLLNPEFLPAATYYVAANGNDAHSASQAQNQATPWQTIDRLDQATFASGDIILFRRGDVFRGQINLRSSGVTFGAYGSGSLPVISGAIPVTGWSIYSGSIYVASVSPIVKNLFVNGNPMTLARYPNTDFLYTESINGVQGFTDQNLTQGSNYWAGAQVWMCANDWSYEYVTVGASSGASVTFASDLQQTAASNTRAYFFQNQLSELDAAREWYYDAGAQKLYLYAPGGINPESLRVEGSVFAYGIQGQRNISGITVQDLQFEKQATAGVWLGGGDGANHTVKDCKFYYQDIFGVETGGDNLRIEHNSFYGINGGAIEVIDGRNSFIRNNDIKRIGMQIGRGFRGGGTGFGIHMGYENASNINVSYNKLDSIGYAGITFNGKDHLIEKNIITHFLQSLADGAAIYTWGGDNLISQNHTIRDNFVAYSGGFSNGRFGGIAHGIYLDNNLYGTTVIHNTVYECNDAGYLLNAGTHNNTVKDNVSYNNKNSQLKIDDWTENFSIYDNRVSNNVLYSLRPEDITLHLNSKFNRYNFGTYDSNYHCNPYQDLVVRRSSYSPTPLYTLAQWKALSGQEAHGQGSLVNWNTCESTGATGNNLVTNGSFNSNTNGWSCWDPQACNVSYSASGMLDGGSLKYSMSSSQNSSILISPSFGLTAGQYYRISFSIQSSLAGTVEFRAAMHHAPWQSYFRRKISYDQTRKEVTIVFQVDATDASSRLEFDISSDSKEFWIDNVELVPVNVVCYEPKDRSPLFTNPSDNTLSVNLNGKSYRDLEGNPVTGSISLPPWSSRVLVLDPTVTSSSTLTIRARGNCGSETMELRINNQAVKTWTNVPASFGEYTYSGYTSGNIKVAFTNDATSPCDHNLQVDYLKLGTTTYQAEAQVTNTGVWNGPASTCGGLQSEWLHCDGYIDFGSSSQARLAAIPESASLLLSPNPADNTVQLTFHSSAKAPVQVSLIDLAGRAHLQKTFSAHPGFNQFTIRTAAVESGLYLVRVKTAEEQKITRLLITR